MMDERPGGSDPTREALLAERTALIAAQQADRRQLLHYAARLAALESVRGYRLLQYYQRALDHPRLGRWVRLARRIMIPPLRLALRCGRLLRRRLK